jgi:hypothetical protein
MPCQQFKVYAIPKTGPGDPKTVQATKGSEPTDSSERGERALVSLCADLLLLVVTGLAGT